MPTTKPDWCSPARFSIQNDGPKEEFRMVIPETHNSALHAYEDSKLRKELDSQILDPWEE